MSEKSKRVHALVNTGPWPGMSEAFDDHMGAACWTDTAYAPDAATWAAAWKAAKRGAETLPADVDAARQTAEYWKAEHLVGNSRIGELHDEVDRLAKQRDDYRHGMTVQMEAVADLVELLRRLADAADALGVNNFGDDWRSDQVQELQAATHAARLVLGPNARLSGAPATK